MNQYFLNGFLYKFAEVEYILNKTGQQPMMPPPQDFQQTQQAQKPKRSLLGTALRYGLPTVGAIGAGVGLYKNWGKITPYLPKVDMGKIKSSIGYQSPEKNLWEKAKGMWGKMKQPTPTIAPKN